MTVFLLGLATPAPGTLVILKFHVLSIHVRVLKALVSFSFLAITACSTFSPLGGIKCKMVKMPPKTIDMTFHTDEIQNLKKKTLSKFNKKELPYFAKNYQCIIKLNLVKIQMISHVC